MSELIVFRMLVCLTNISALLVTDSMEPCSVLITLFILVQVLLGALNSAGPHRQKQNDQLIKTNRIQYSTYHRLTRMSDNNSNRE